MWESLSGVVLNVIKYNDRNNIAHIYTDRHGMMSFLVAQGSTRAAQMRRAMFMPLSLLQFEARIVPGREIFSLRDVRRLTPLSGIYGDPVKGAVAMFVSEVLCHSIQERERNDALYSYVESSVRLLDRLRHGVANFHICFLWHLGAFLGIGPNMGTYRDGYWFDMQGGTFSSAPPDGNCGLKPQDARVIALLSRITFANMHLYRFSHDERNRVLDLIISYYRLHSSTLGTLKTPAVLRQIFS